MMFLLRGTRPENLASLSWHVRLVRPTDGLQQVYVEMSPGKHLDCLRWFNRIVHLLTHSIESSC